MKTGDIVYFKLFHIIDGDYICKPGDKYIITSLLNNNEHSYIDPVSGFIIKNLEGGTSHYIDRFTFSEKIITHDQWRELQLEKLI